MALNLFIDGVEVEYYAEDLIGKEISYITVDDDEIFLITTDKTIFHRRYILDVDYCMNSESFSVEDYYDMFKYDNNEDITKALTEYGLIDHETVSKLQKERENKRLRKEREKEEREYKEYLKLKEKYEHK